MLIICLLFLLELVVLCVGIYEMVTGKEPAYTYKRYERLPHIVKKEGKEMTIAALILMGLTLFLYSLL